MKHYFVFILGLITLAGSARGGEKFDVVRNFTSWTNLPRTIRTDAVHVMAYDCVARVNRVTLEDSRGRLFRFSYARTYTTYGGALWSVWVAEGRDIAVDATAIRLSLDLDQPEGKCRYEVETSY